MQDIIIEGSNQSSNVAASVRKTRGKKPRSMISYVFNWIIKGLFVFLLLGIDFLLFAGSGNQSVFADGVILQPEVCAILAGLLVFSLILMFLVSFSSFLQNLLTAVLAAGFMLALLNQFALYDKTSILVPLLSPYLGVSVASMFAGVSHWVLAALVGVVTLIVFMMSSKANIAYFTGILLIVFLGIAADNYIVKDKRSEFNVEFDNHLNKKVGTAKKYVYLFLPNATSYVALGELKDQLGKTEKAQETQERLIAFLAKNGFWVYPHAYVKEREALNNMVEAINSMDDKLAGEHVQKNVEITSLWNFHNVRDEDIFIKDAQLIDVFKNSKYQVTGYQSRGIDFCRKNNEINVDKCVGKVNVPVNAGQAGKTVWDKSKFLLLQWLNSFHFISDWSAVYGTLNEVMSMDKMPVVGVSYDSLYVVNSFRVLDLLLEDIAKDDGNRAYFVFMDLPSDMYVYDQFCRMKPQDKWLTMDNYKWVSRKNVFEKRTAYQEQLSCMIGKLEQFMLQLKEKQLDKNTVIVLQGLSGINDIGNAKTENYIENFKSENLVLLAIKDPARNNFSINNHFCESRELVRNYLYKQGNCREFNRIELGETAARGLQSNLLQSVVSEKKVNKALRDFDEWFAKWQSLNNGEIPDVNQSADKAVTELLPEIQESTSENEVEADVSVPEVAVGETKVMDSPLIEQGEAVVESMSAAISESAAEAEDLPAELSETAEEAEDADKITAESDEAALSNQVE